MKNTKAATVVIPVLATLALIYSNLYQPQYANILFFATIVLWIGWWLVNFQFFTGDRPGLLTSKTEKALSQAHAEKLHADAAVHGGHAAIASSKTNQARAEFDLKEAQGNFTRGQLLAEALHNNAMLIASKATEMGVPVGNYTDYLMKTLEQKVKYETAVLISKTELEKERHSIEETIRLTLTESSLKFEDRLALIDQISEVKKRLDNTTDRMKRELLKEEMSTLKARLDAARQTDLPKTDRAQA